MSEPAPLQVDADGWIAGIRHLPTESCDARPPQTVVDLLVLHNISLPPGQYRTGRIDELFCNALDADGHPFFALISGLRVSAHFLVERDGRLTQYVSCRRRAWHAGASIFGDRSGCNDFSIGIELEGTDFTPFSAAQYEALAKLTAALRAALPLRAVRGHSDIAPGRKTDPGPMFDWQHYARAAQLPQDWLPAHAPP